MFSLTSLGGLDGAICAAKDLESVYAHSLAKMKMESVPEKVRDVDLRGLSRQFRLL